MSARNLCMQQISFFDDKNEAGKKNDFLPASDSDFTQLALAKGVIPK